MLYAFAPLALVLSGMSFVLPMRLHREDTNEAERAAVAALMSPFVISLALSEAVVLFGSLFSSFERIRGAIFSGKNNEAQRPPCSSSR